MKRRTLFVASATFGLMLCGRVIADDVTGSTRTYRNRLNRIESPQPLLADHPEFFEPIVEQAHYEAPAIMNDPGADLHGRAWRYTYNARGIIEIPNLLQAILTDNGVRFVESVDNSGFLDHAGRNGEVTLERHTSTSSHREATRPIHAGHGSKHRWPDLAAGWPHST